MPDILSEIPIVDAPVERPYLPFLPAVESGVLRLADIALRTLKVPLGVSLVNGRLPHAADAGVIDTPEGVLAVDHTHIISYDRTTLKIGPSCKSDVATQEDGEGVFQSGGALSIANDQGWFRIVGAAVDRIRDPWLAHRLQAAHTAGRTAVALFGLEAADYEVTDIDPDTGIMTARPRRVIK